MAEQVIVFGEFVEQSLRKVTFEAIRAATEMIEEAEVVTVLLGKDVKESDAKLCTTYGANRVIIINSSELEHYRADAYGQALLSVIREESPTGIIIPDTTVGRDLAPRIAAKLDSGLLLDVIRIERTDRDISYIKPIYNNEAFERAVITEELQFITIRPNQFSAFVPDEARTGEIIEKTLEITGVRTNIKSIVSDALRSITLSEANVIIAGGRGMRSKELFDQLYDLANILGGTVGASRGAYLEGYCDESLLVGQTNTKVAPDIYIACGISGAPQHTAGILGAKVIIAINKDADAEIFKFANYGLVGNIEEILPELIEEARKLTVLS